jgi:hypothetical protein
MIKISVKVKCGKYLRMKGEIKCYIYIYIYIYILHLGLAVILATLDSNCATRFEPELPHALARLDRAEPRAVLELIIFIGPCN